MRLSPMWKGLRSTAHTLRHDWAALGAHTMYGAPLDPEEWARRDEPALVVYGGKSPEPLREGSKALAAVLPDAELIEIAGRRPRHQDERRRAAERGSSPPPTRAAFL